MSKELRKANAKTLDNAFKGLLKRVEVAIPKALEEVLDKAVNEAFDIHEFNTVLPGHKDHHDIHLKNQHYGWVLLHDGDVKKSKFWDGSTPSTDWVMDAISKSVFATGWVGVLVCDLSNERYPYGTDFEIDLFNYIGEGFEYDYNFIPTLVKLIRK